MPTSPVFSRSQKLLPNPLMPIALHDIQTLDIAYRSTRITAIRVGSQIHFQKANYFPILGLGDQDRQGQRYQRLTFENRGDFSIVFLCGRLRPQCHTQTHEITAVKSLSGPDANIWHDPIVPTNKFRNFPQPNIVHITLTSTRNFHDPASGGTRAFLVILCAPVVRNFPKRKSKIARNRGKSLSFKILRSDL